MQLAYPQSVNRRSMRAIIAEKVMDVIKAPCKRVLFVHPLQTPERFFDIERALTRRLPNPPPYGCGVLAKNLELRGYETSILDLNFDLLSYAHREPSNFQFSRWRELLISRLEEFKPDLIAISCMFSISHESMQSISNLIKEYKGALPVIAGGVHVTNARKLVLEDCGNIDFIGIYEGDRSLADLLDFVNGQLSVDQLSQIATLIDGTYLAIEERATPDQKDIQQAPEYHALPIGMYDSLGQFSTYGFMAPGRKSSTVLSNRGCRAHCSFCSVASFNGAGVRTRDPKNVVDEIETLVSKYGIQHIMWLDDDLFFNAKRTIALFNEIVRRNIHITWDASNGIIAAAITPELAHCAIESGCVGLTLGIESGNPQILHEVHKPGTLNSFRRAKEILSQYPQLFIKGFLMVGFPNETLGMMLDTVNFALELKLDWYPLQILTPLPSTEIYKTMLDAGFIEDNLATSTVAQMAGPHGRLRLQEEREKLSAREFFNLFMTGDLSSIPSKEKLGDIWFLMDYKVNYEKILNLGDVIKLRSLGKWLEDVCDRITKENPLANLFLGVIESKLGNSRESRRRKSIARSCLQDSVYWQRRFEALELYSLLEESGGLYH